MRFVSIACAAVFGLALVACADAEVKTSTFGNMPSKSSIAKSEELPVEETEKTEPAPADAGAQAQEETPDWMANCLPFIPCFPPDESKPADTTEEETTEETPDWTEDCMPFVPCFPEGFVHEGHRG